MISSERSHASTSMSGGGVGASVYGLGRDDDAGHVADERPAGLLVEVADVVGGVAGRVLDPEGALDPRLPALEDAQVLLRDRDDLAPQPRQAVLAAVQARGAGDEPLGVDEVLGPALVDVDRQVGPAAHERARGAGVVEVDVGQEQGLRLLPADGGEQRLLA